LFVDLGRYASLEHKDRADDFWHGRREDGGNDLVGMDVKDK
jgi:hypothetical protein